KTIVNGFNGISPEDERYLVNANGPILLTGRTGCGKTEVIVRLVKSNRPAWSNVLGMAISIVLTGGMADRFDLTPVSSKHPYADREALNNSSVSVESIYRTKGHTYDALATDEVDIALRRFFEQQLGQNSQDQNLKQLRKLQAETPHQFYMQANPSPVTLDALEHLTGQRPQVVEIVRQTGQVSNVQVTVCEDGFDEYSGVPLRGSKTVVDEVLKVAKGGGKVCVLAGSVGNLKAMQRILRRHRIAVTLRDGSYTLAPIAVGFGENPTAHAALRNVTLICRNAEIGVDLQNDFDLVAFWASPGQSAEDCYQHISRARALFDGRCNRLLVKLPEVKAKFVSVDHLDPAYHLKAIQAKNAYYLGLLRGAGEASGQQLEQIEARIAELDTIHGFLARYKAEEAAGQLFQREYLLERFEALGWAADHLDPEPATSDFNDELRGLKRKAEEARAFAIAKGRRVVGAYSEARISQLEDPNQTGFVLSAYRQKLDLATKIPESPIDNAAWVLEHILDNERQLPQAQLLGLVILSQQPDFADCLKEFHRQTQGLNIKIGMTFGPIAMLRGMEGSRTLPLLDVWSTVLSNGPRFILDLVTGDRTTIHRLEPDVAEFAANLRQHGDRLNSMAKFCLGKSDGFNWGESDDMAIVNKFLSAFLGLNLSKVGQVRVGTERPPTYALSGTKIGAYRNANKAAVALARTEGQIGPVAARVEAQNKILSIATTTGDTGAADTATDELAKLRQRLTDLKTKAKEQQQRMAAETQSADKKWPEILRQYSEHLDMAASAALGWLARVNQEREWGVNLNEQTLFLLSKFRLTPPPLVALAPKSEPPPDPPASPKLRHYRTGETAVMVQLDEDGFIWVAPTDGGRHRLVAESDWQAIAA
ncbi:hypothetical protein C8B47_06670, partial [filamentous cyanobacterium CCP4]